MRLNPDCVRDILLTIEETTTFNKFMRYYVNNSTFERLANYTHDEIVYHVRQCKMAQLIVNVTFNDGGDYFSIQDLSPKGHEFLENIRSDNMWNDTKAVATKVGSYSLSSLTIIATGILTQIINHHLGIS